MQAEMFGGNMDGLGIGDNACIVRWWELSDLTDELGITQLQSGKGQVGGCSEEVSIGAGVLLWVVITRGEEWQSGWFVCVCEDCVGWLDWWGEDVWGILVWGVWGLEGRELGMDEEVGSFGSSSSWCLWSGDGEEQVGVKGGSGVLESGVSGFGGDGVLIRVGVFWESCWVWEIWVHDDGSQQMALLEKRCSSSEPVWEKSLVVIGTGEHVWMCGLVQFNSESVL